MLDGEFDIRPYNHTSIYCNIRHTNNGAYMVYGCTIAYTSEPPASPDFLFLDLPLPA